MNSDENSTNTHLDHVAPREENQPDHRGEGIRHSNQGVRDVHEVRGGTRMDWLQHAEDQSRNLLRTIEANLDPINLPVLLTVYAGKGTDLP